MTAVAGGQVARRVLPTQNVGSVDVFLETFESAEEDDVLVVDNGGRWDEACVGDLVALEAQSPVKGLVVWGLPRHSGHHRVRLAGLQPRRVAGRTLRLDPQPADELPSATIGDWTVTVVRGAIEG